MRAAHAPWLAVVLFLGAFDAHAKLTAEPAPSVSFHAIGPAGMKIVGTTSDLSVTDDGTKVTVTVALANLTTGMELRDKHMREKYLEVPKFPSATLAILRGDLQLPAEGATTDADATGTFTLHGVARVAKFHYAAKREAGIYKVDATIHVHMKDYDIEEPSYLGASVKPDVDVEVHYRASDR